MDSNGTLPLSISKSKKNQRCCLEYVCTVDAGRQIFGHCLSIYENQGCRQFVGKMDCPSDSCNFLKLPHRAEHDRGPMLSLVTATLIKCIH